jgi:hypothetical protein
MVLEVSTVYSSSKKELMATHLKKNLLRACYAYKEHVQQDAANLYCIFSIKKKSTIRDPTQ